MPLAISRARPARVIFFGYLLVILIGAGLLSLPFATRDGNAGSIVDALFTSTSATCVTGLVVQDTYTHWSLFGQSVILLLIEIGGLGFSTILVGFLTFTNHKVGITERSVLQDSLAAPNLGGVVRTGRTILKFTLLFELFGACLLAIRFIPRYGWLRGAYFSIFHSISAFCNAGFDLMGAESSYASLTPFVSDPLINITVTLLILVGGFGFLVWGDIFHNRTHFRRYSLHTKIVLVTTIALIAVGVLFIGLFEMRHPAFEGQSVGTRISSLFFQSISLRTAGFATVQPITLQSTSLLVVTLLMLIGGAPGSTAGGIKTTTFGVLMLTVLSVFRKRKSVEAFGRRIDDGIIHKSIAVLFIYVIIIGVSAIAIHSIDALPLLDSLFETTAAISTAGSSLGLTPHSGTITRLILCCLMIFGRVGCLTVIYFLTDRAADRQGKLPQGFVIVG